MARLYQKVEIFDILGPHSHPCELIGVKFRVAKRTHVPLGREWCNESPLRGENADFWPVSKFYTGSLPLCDILPVKTKKPILLIK